MSTVHLPLRASLHDAISACFLGPRAENFNILEELFHGALAEHAKTRLEYNPGDGDFITSSMKNSQLFRDTTDSLRTQAKKVSELLNTHSIPFFSTRYIGHMCMEMSMPSMVGWMITILFNPNNVAFEASPVTTIIELEVGQQLCTMLGYAKQGHITPWGHIGADGTIANMESMWAARNLKFYPLSVHAAMTQGDKPLAFIVNDFKVTTCDDPNPQFLSQLTPWQLLNLTPDVVLGIPDQLTSQYGVTSTFLANALSPYLAQTAGKEKLMKMYNIESEPQYFISSTKHYSWPKAAALVGIGSENCVNVKVDICARIDISALTAALQDCVDNKRAVYAVVAVIGSTEEGAVDPLDQILALKPTFAAKGLSFVVHADAAWGGYYASMIRDRPTLERGLPGAGEDPDRDFVPSITLRDSTVTQFKALAQADSITIDPHKAGYIPYPAGGLCYHDGRMRYLLTWTAPYIDQGDKGDKGHSIGIYGIEGSKPGAPAVACYLHHSVLGLHKEGHGALLGEASFTCRRFAAHWSAMSDDTTDFIVVPFNPVLKESDKDIIRKRILGKTNEEIIDDKEAFDVLCTLGSDLNINAFTCNFRINGQVNDDVEEANYLNKRVFSRFSITQPSIDPKTIPLFLSSTVFAQADYGDCVRDFQTRMGLETDSRQDLFVLRNVVMSPFQSAGDFVSTLAQLFQEGLEAEVANVVARNTVSPQTHDFIMQGLDTVYLAYRPLFHHANGRHQLILAVQFSNPTQAAQYKAVRLAKPTVPFRLSTHVETTIEDILRMGTFVGDIIVGSAVSILSVEITIATVVKHRPLTSRWRDQTYPASYTPFYLYGTPTEQNIDHMLLRAPNAQITSDLVTLDCTPALTADQLASGVIVYLNRPEAALQPLRDDAAGFFNPGTSFNVTIFADANAPDARGPGLSQGGTQFATGTLTLGQAVFYDPKRLNTEDFAKGRKVSGYTSTDLSDAEKAEWQTFVKGALGIKPFA